MIKNRIKNIRNQFKKNNIDGYIVPKNDEFFSEYSEKDRLNFISNFSGSAGYALILKNKNYLFVDGRYTIQANIESNKNFIITKHEKLFDCKLFKNLKIGFDAKLFTSQQITSFFSKYNKPKAINQILIDKIFKNKKKINKPFYSLNKKIVGESHLNKMNRIYKFLKKNNIDYLYVTAPENVAWLLNIRGNDNPSSPIPNSNFLISKNKKKFIISEKSKLKKIIQEKKIKTNEIVDFKNIENFLTNLKGGSILIDKKTCSFYKEKILSQNLKVIKIDDPIYLFKSIKNKTEIMNMKKAHILDGAALTKFLYWIKKVNKKKITEIFAQNKLEKYRKKNKNYLFPSFNTIAGSGKNGAIVHYRAKKNKKKYIEKNEIFLCDSGGQYKYGTTDVTRTICFSKPSKNVKKIFTNVLKGHIAVANTNLNKKKFGSLIDKDARKFLKQNNLDYNHGTGHGVGYFLNVHEGPQAISKYNFVPIQEGMVLSNEPGFYKKGKFGIRIENLVYAKKENKKFYFENLTMAPIDTDMIDYKLLTKNEKNYLLKYHLDVYSNISSLLNVKEKKWLISII